MENEGIYALLSALKTLKVGGVTKVVKLTGTEIGVTAVTYADGDTLGTTSPIELKNCLRPLVDGIGTGIIQSIVTRDLTNQKKAYDVLIFDSEPTSTTFTNATTLVVSDIDMPKLLGRLSVVSGDYTSFSNNSEATSTAKGLPVQSVTGGSLWVAFVCRGTPSYVANEFGVTFGILQD